MHACVLIQNVDTIYQRSLLRTSTYIYIFKTTKPILLVLSLSLSFLQQKWRNGQNKNDPPVILLQHFNSPFSIHLDGHIPLRRVHTRKVHRNLTLRVQPQLAPHLTSQLSNLLILQQLHHHCLKSKRRRLRSLPMPRRPLHAGLRLLRQ